MREKVDGPIRMCIGCRRKRKKEEFLRLTVGSQGALTFGKKKPVEGRGFYLCPDVACLKKAERKRGESIDFQDFLTEGLSHRRKGNGEE